MTTPEGRVKRKVSAYLKSLGDSCYYFMPVQMGYGASALDYMGAYKGKAFAIETKASGNHPTALQQFTIQRMRQAKMAVFVVSCDEELEHVKRWFGGDNAAQIRLVEEGHQRQHQNREGSRQASKAGRRHRAAQGGQSPTEAEEEMKGGGNDAA